MGSRYQPDRKCPECKGAGSIEILDGPGACADGYDVACAICLGEGSIDATHEDYATAPRWTEESVDPLLAMASYRRTFLNQYRLWPSLGTSSHAYSGARRRAMALVDLPVDDAHLLVTPETAAYFNALNHREAA